MFRIVEWFWQYIADGVNYDTALQVFFTTVRLYNDWLRSVL
jgi:hypothetical protein